MRRSLRELLDELRLHPEESDAECVERCMEALFDPERAPAGRLGEREEAEIEAQRRRWTHAGPTTA
jgi:hypothetical protein